MADTEAPPYNPALVGLAPLIGNWRMELYGASFLTDPDARLAGMAVIDWVEDGAAVVMRQGDREQPRSSTWIVGRDESETGYQVLYSDSRGVSRLYRMAVEDGQWTMSRTTPGFAQRFTGEIAPDGRSVHGRWEKSFDGGETWENDFNLDYLRL